MKIIKIRTKLINGIMERIPYTLVNGHPEKRLPGNAFALSI